MTAVFLCGISLLQAQPVRVSETLKELEMENISVVEKRDTITAAFETSAYRGIYNYPCRFDSKMSVRRMYVG